MPGDRDPSGRTIGAGRRAMPFHRGAIMLSNIERQSLEKSERSRGIGIALHHVIGS